MRINGKDRAVLAQVVTAHQNGQTYFVLAATAEKLEKAGFVQVNRQTAQNDKGELLVRATDAGVTEASKPPAERQARGPAAPMPVIPGTGFTMETGIAVAETRRGAVGRDNPWADALGAMTVGQSFFVPVSNDVPEPWKRLQGIIGSANKRFSKGNDKRRYVVREQLLNPAKPEAKNNPKGARVHRLSPNSPAAA